MTNSCMCCGDRPTIRAHIFPKSAIRAIRCRGPDKHTLAVMHDRAIKARSQNGIYDSKILCHSCDGRIGNLDKWFMENIETFHASAVGRDPFEPIVSEIDSRAALRFAISVIYRASLSKLDHFDQISLGLYTKNAGEIALGSDDADYSLSLVLVNVLTSDHLDMRQWAFYPVRCAGDNGSYFIFALSGIQFLVKFGGRSRGVSSDDNWSQLLRISLARQLVVCSYPFDESGEADFLRAAKRASDIR